MTRSFLPNLENAIDALADIANDTNTTNILYLMKEQGFNDETVLPSQRDEIYKAVTDYMNAQEKAMMGANTDRLPFFRDRLIRIAGDFGSTKDFYSQ